jgi:tetratricopeptide (TPR) repeat protein
VNQSKAFIIIGHPRSGTTALARLLNASRHIACLYYEGNLLYRLWRMLSRSRIFEEPHEDLVVDFKITATHNLIKRAGKTGCEKIIFKPSAIDRLVQGFQTDLSSENCKYEIYDKSVKRFFQLFPTYHSSSAVGDKVPDYVYIPDVLIDAQPDSKFIYIQRDPRAVVHSTLCFQPETLHLFAVPCAFAMTVSYFLIFRRIKRFLRCLSEKQILCVAQETLKENPYLIAERLSEFFEIPLCSYMEDYASMMRQQKTVKNWKQEMREADVKAVEAVTHCAGLELAEAPRFYGCNNIWEEKASSVLALVDRQNASIESKLNDIQKIFQSDNRFVLAFTIIKIGDYHHARGDFEAAYPLFEAACSLIENNAVAWFKFAELCFDMKLLTQAKNYFSKLTSLMPVDSNHRLLTAKTLFKLGRIERLTGSSTNAKIWFERSLKIYPKFSLAKAMLEILRN